MFRLILFFFLFSALAMPPSCGKKNDRREIRAGVETWTLPEKTAAPEETVAEVDGEPVTAAQVAAIARREHLSPEQALQKAIDTRLILRQAALGAGPGALSDAFKTAAVERLLRDFEQKNKPQDIPDAELKKIYDEIQKKDFSPPPFSGRKFHFSHGQWRASSQLIVKTSEKHDAETVSAVDSLLLLVRDHYLSSADRSEESFRNHAWLVQNTYVPVSFEQLPPISMDNEENFYRFNGEFDRQYLEKLFELPAEGAVSGVFGTKFGRHWVYLVRIVPERRLSFEEARGELRELVSEGWQNQRFEEWLERLRSEYRVQAPGRRDQP